MALRYIPKNLVIQERCSQVLRTSEWPLSFRETRPEATVIVVRMKMSKEKTLRKHIL